MIRTARTKTDPWLLASEIALADTRHKTPTFLKVARSLVDAEKIPPFHLSELAGALATIEASAGNFKKARRLYDLSLSHPAENAIAQAAWLRRQVKQGGWNPHAVPSLVSNEANAWKAQTEGNWSAALDEARDWQADQPFSSRPAVFGSWVATAGMDDFKAAEQMLKFGLMSNRDDVMLNNNLAFALAKQGNVIDAKDALARVLSSNPSWSERICLHCY